MFEVQCLDSYGNTINHFSQWDVNQKIIIKIDSCNLQGAKIPSSPAYSCPQVHYGNKTRSETLIVRSEAIDETTISADVPNILLQDACSLQIYVYLTDPEDVSSQKIILQNEIPVRKRQKPSDYSYVENIDRVTAEMIKEEIEDVVNNTRQAAIDSVNTVKNAAIQNVDDTAQAARDNIDDTTSAAMKEVDNQMDADYDEGSITVGENTYTGGFINIGNDIISELDQIKEDSSDVYDETVAIAEATQTQIEKSINATMTENGLTVQPTDDGNGNVDIVILLNQSTGS